MPYFVFFLFVMIISAPAMAVTGACKTAKNTVDEIACASEKYDAANEALSVAYAAYEETEDPEGLRAAQQAWIEYRDAECIWEAAGAENESLARLQEIECLVKATEARTAYFQILNDAEERYEDRQDEEAPLVESPRWLNALAEAKPEAYWRYSERLEADLNCDGVSEIVLPGLQHDDVSHPIVVVSENPALGLPKSFIFAVSSQDAGSICGPSLTLSVVENFDSESEDDVCKQALKVTADDCPQHDISWNGEGYVFHRHVEDVQNPDAARER